MIPILHHKIHQLIVHMYTKLQSSSINSSWENCDIKQFNKRIELQSYGQTKSSTAPLTKRGYKYSHNIYRKPEILIFDIHTDRALGKREYLVIIRDNFL